MPTVGRIVHYHGYGQPAEYPTEARAAVVTTVPDNDPLDARPAVGLAILDPGGIYFLNYVEYTSEPSPGCWTWPPRA